MGTSLGRFIEACELFYEAIGDPAVWPRALRAVADSAGATGVSLIPVGLGHGATITSNGLEDYIADFVAGGWETSNSRMLRGLELTQAGKRGLITDRDMFTPEQLRKDRFYNEFIAPHKMGATAGMVLTRAGSDLILPISFERRAALGAFQRDEIRTMNVHMSYLLPAATLALRLGFARTQSFADALGAVGKDVILLSYTGRVLYVSPSAERHFGDALRLQSGRLHSWHQGADASLLLALSKAVSSAVMIDRLTSNMRLPRRSSGAALRAQVIPLAAGAQDIFSLARAAVVLSDSPPSGPDPLLPFRLTPAERRLALRIAAGESLKASAEAERISVETARSRLKIIFEKTGTHRQAELVLLIARQLH